MVLGLSLSTFTTIHVIISLIGIASGLVVLGAMLGAQRVPRWTMLFLVTTILTSLTGFLFPISGFTPALGVGAISIAVLAIALLALYARRLSGAWRWVYVVTALVALYFNCFVAVVQSFQKIPALNALAPTASSEPAFVFAQLLLLAFFVIVGTLAVLRFRPAELSAA
jgi:hypothetical protein